MNRKDERTVVLLTDLDIREDTGASKSRLLCYSKALSLVNIKVIFSSVYYKFQPADEPESIEKNIFSLGQKDSKHFDHKTYPVLNEFNFNPIIYYLRRLFRKYKDNVNVIFLLYPSNLALSLISALYLRIYKRKKVFVEKNELHFGIALNLLPALSYKSVTFFPLLAIQSLIGLITDLVEALFSGSICISTRMEKLYGLIYKKVIRIPILVDFEDLLGKDSVYNEKDFFNLGFFGTISEKKDGIFNLIKAISDLNSLNYKIQFNLYGTITNSIYFKLNRLLSKLKLQNSVKYYGNLNFKDVRREMILQDLVVLTRPRNIQNNYGFSTKLAEYMASGVPVISTLVSDVPLYLKDGVNGFLIRNNSAKEIQVKLKEILNNKDKLNLVGQEAKKTAFEEFSYSKYSDKIDKFLFDRF
jgi:glycosyltransferase involved in cell wall biosynthesis